MKKEKFIVSALKKGVYLVAMLVLLVTSCNESDNFAHIPGTVSDAVMTLTAAPHVQDSAALSVLTFEQVATVKNGATENDLQLYPEASVRIVLSKSSIDISSVDSLPIEVVKSYIISKNPYVEGTELGQDITKVFEFSNGLKAEVTSCWRYKGIIDEKNDTVVSPHVEITDVNFDSFSYAEYGEKTDTTDTYKMALAFNVNYVSSATTTDAIKGTVRMVPDYLIVVDNGAEIVRDVEYCGQYVGSPYNAYELTEKVRTNRREFTNTYKAEVSLDFVTPEVREQPSLDSLFNTVSKGTLEQKELSVVDDTLGFKVRTMNGTYISSNTGKSGQSIVDNTVSFTYKFPTEFVSEYGSYTIPLIGIEFEELGFKVTKLSENADAKRFKSLNSIQAKFGDCKLNVIDEQVNLVVVKEKPVTVTAVDSTYTLSGSGDEYKVEKKVTYSDKKTQTFNYPYTGRHSFSADPFGAVITSDLKWTAGKLQKSTQTPTEKTEEEKFSETTKFSVVYTTTLWDSFATNGTQSRRFYFRETVPTVTFIDGKVSKTFPARTYVITGKGAKLDTKSVSVIIGDARGEAYTYEYTATAKFSNLKEETVVSSGRLLIKADEAGEPVYKASYSWDGDTYTAKVVKTIPHTNAEDEVQTFEKSVTVSLENFDHIQVTADRANVDFQKINETPSLSSTTDLPWTVKNYSTLYAYADVNEAVRKRLLFYVNDAEIVFSDGAYQHTFDVRATVTTSNRFGESKVENGCEVTPYYFTVTATIGEKTLTAAYIVDISVKRYSSQTIVYGRDGVVDCEVTITNDDGTTEKFIASEAFGSMFAFDFSEAEIDRNDDIISNNDYKLSGSIGEAISSKKHQQGNWVVTEKLYPYTIVFDNGVAEDKIAVTYTFKNYEFAFTHSRTGTVMLLVPEVQMSYTYKFQYLGQEGDYLKYNWELDISAIVSATTGVYRLSKSTSVQASYENVVMPNEPHLGKAKAFYVTAVYDPEAKVTKRAFISLWEKGVKFAVCDFERTFPKSQDYKICLDTYAGYNAVGYDPNATYHWRPARSEKSGNTLSWYRSDGTVMYSLTESECQAVGWENVVNGQYAIEIPGYSYSIVNGGYHIQYITPDGKRKSAIGDYIPSMVVTY